MNLKDKLLQKKEVEVILKNYKMLINIRHKIYHLDNIYQHKNKLQVNQQYNLIIC